MLFASGGAWTRPHHNWTVLILWHPFSLNFCLSSIESSQVFHRVLSGKREEMWCSNWRSYLWCKGKHFFLVLASWFWQLSLTSFSWVDVDTPSYLVPLCCELLVHKSHLFAVGAPSLAENKPATHICWLLNKFLEQSETVPVPVRVGLVKLPSQEYAAFKLCLV